jgi:transcriptional regulator with XRE-family HTH domain
MPIDNEKQAVEEQEILSSPELKKLTERQKELELLTLKRESVAKRLQAIDGPVPTDLSDVQKKNVEANAALYRQELAEFDAQIKTLEKEVADLNAVIARNKHFDKYLLFQNIRELIKGTEIKLGQIEKEAGCQPGYMSRLDKTDSATDPTVEFIVTASRLLGVSVDILLNVTIKYLTPKELYMIKFLEKLIRDTVSEKLNWVKEPLYSLQDIYEDEDERLWHPLFDSYQATGADSGGNTYQTTQFYFPSEAFGRKTEIAGDCYHLELKNNATLYFMYVKEGGSADDEEGKCAFELWMYSKKSGASFLCGDNAGKVMVTKLVFNLWMAIEQYMTRPRVNKDHKSIIDAFMNDDLTDDPVSSDELPF